MTWIVLEGLDRSGKSSVAEYYKSKGYHYIHMDAPDKKYKKEGYVGPGYVDEMMDLYTTCDGRDVVFDRTIYGEKIWPAVYGRDSQLSYDDFEALADYEKQNDSQYILMWDENYDAHWKRCYDNKEPLTRGQFNHAVAMYERLEKFGFIKRQLPEFKEVQEFLAKKDEPKAKDESDKQLSEKTEIAESTKKTKIIEESKSVSVGTTAQQLKLEEANAINSLLKGRIIKKRGPIFDDLEKEMRDFLNSKLSNIFGNSNNNNNFTEIEIQVLKLYAERILARNKEQ